MKKIICSFLVCVFMLQLLPTTALASESTPSSGDFPESICVRIWENPSTDDFSIASDVMPYYGEQQYTEVVNSQSVSLTTTPDGQYSGGYSFPSSGGSIYINTAKGSSTTLSVSVGWGIVSVDLNVGLVDSSGSVNGICVNVPADNNHYIVKLRHNCTVRQLKIDYYQYSIYLRTDYVTRTTVDSIDALLIKV